MILRRHFESEICRCSRWAVCGELWSKWKLHSIESNNDQVDSMCFVNESLPLKSFWALNKVFTIETRTSGNGVLDWVPLFIHKLQGRAIQQVGLRPIVMSISCLSIHHGSRFSDSQEWSNTSTTRKEIVRHLLHFSNARSYEHDIESEAKLFSCTSWTFTPMSSYSWRTFCCAQNVLQSWTADYGIDKQFSIKRLYVESSFFDEPQRFLCFPWAHIYLMSQYSM